MQILVPESRFWISRSRLSHTFECLRFLFDPSGTASISCSKTIPAFRVTLPTKRNVCRNGHMYGFELHQHMRMHNHKSQQSTRDRTISKHKATITCTCTHNHFIQTNGCSLTTWLHHLLTKETGENRLCWLEYPWRCASTTAQTSSNCKHRQQNTNVVVTSGIQNCRWSTRAAQ